MRLAFYLIAAAMLVLALAALLLPLLRRGRQLGRPRGVFALALAILLAMPLATWLLYRAVGTPAALDGVAQQPPPTSIAQALAELRAHLRQQPRDLAAWLLMAQAQTALRQPDAAHDAYAHALQIDAGNSVAMVGWAETEAMLAPTHRFDARACALLAEVVRREPDNQKGLWLLGIAQFQQAHYADASATWRKLLALLPPGGEVAQAVAQQVAAADARANGHLGNTPPTAPATGTPASTGSTSARDAVALHVQVRVAPALAGRVRPGDVLFVYARDPAGPPMPLAVTRLDANALPAEVTLTDAMAMVPAMKLSSVPHVFVGARISHSGQAIAQPGDLEGDAGVVAVRDGKPISIVIDRVH